MGIEERIAPGCGLTKREWLIGQALAGTMWKFEDGGLESERVAEICEQAADAILRRLEKRRETEAADYSDGTAEYGVKA